MTGNDFDVMSLLSAFYRQVLIFSCGNTASLRRAASQLADPALSVSGFWLDAELAWVAWLESQAVDAEDDAARLEALIHELVPDTDACHRYFETFPPGDVHFRFRRRRVQVADALARRRTDVRESGPTSYRYAAASKADELTTAMSGDDWRTSIRYVVDEGYLRCFVDIESQRDITAARFRIDIQFKGGKQMSCVFLYPEQSQFGVNVGSLRGLRLEDIESYRVTQVGDE